MGKCGIKRSPPATTMQRVVVICNCTDQEVYQHDKDGKRGTASEPHCLAPILQELVMISEIERCTKIQQNHSSDLSLVCYSYPPIIHLFG